MNKVIVFPMALCVLSLGACGKSPSENLADRVENAADARAASMEAQAGAMANQADTLKEQADRIRETGDQRSAAIEAAGQNVTGMSQGEANAVVAGDAPAVR